MVTGQTLGIDTVGGSHVIALGTGIATAMGIYDRPYYQDGPGGLRLRAPRSAVAQLIVINVVVYLADTLILSDWLFQHGALTPASLLRPWLWWRLVTYGFLHDPGQVGHIIFNMLGLFFFGRELEMMYGRRRFLGFYLTAIIVSGAVWALRLLLTTQAYGVPVVGASGAIVAIVILFTMHFPRRTVLLYFLIPIPVWVLGVVLVVMNIWGVRTGAGRVAYDVHLVGAAYGFLYYYRRWDLSMLWAWPSGDWRRTFRRRPKLRVHDPDRSSDRLAEQADSVLEKLHREGEASLTSRERKILEEYSRRIRRRG